MFSVKSEKTVSGEVCLTATGQEFSKVVIMASIYYKYGDAISALWHAYMRHCPDVCSCWFCS